MITTVPNIQFQFQTREEWLRESQQIRGQKHTTNNIANRVSSRNKLMQNNILCQDSDSVIKLERNRTRLSTKRTRHIHMHERQDDNQVMPN